MERSSRVPQYENLIFFLFKNVQNWQNWILTVVHWETKSSWLRQYQSYISYWYVNRKVFISTTTWEPNFLKKIWNKFKIELDLFLYSYLCWRAEINIQVGLNMHLYVDMGMHWRPFEGRHLVLSVIDRVFQGHHPHPLRMLRPDWWRGGNNFHDQTLTQKVSTCMNIQWIKDPIMTISKRFTNFNFYNLG